MALVAVAAVWAGCGNDTAGGDGGGGMPFVPDPPSVYVAKVKNILVGLPPTDSEVAQVTSDPNPLGGLIDGWMKLLEYQQKMMVFVELAFQQTQISAADFVDIVPPNGLGVGRAIPLLVQNVRESFARTVLELVAEGKPLTRGVHDHAADDDAGADGAVLVPGSRQVDDAAAVNDLFARANKGLKIVMETSGGPIPFADSINPASPNFMHWYTSDLPGLTFPDKTSCRARLHAGVVRQDHARGGRCRRGDDRRADQRRQGDPRGAGLGDHPQTARAVSTTRPSLAH